MIIHRIIKWRQCKTNSYNFSWATPYYQNIYGQIWVMALLTNVKKCLERSVPMVNHTSTIHIQQICSILVLFWKDTNGLIYKFVVLSAYFKVNDIHRTAYSKKRKTKTLWNRNMHEHKTCRLHKMKGCAIL